MRSLYHNLASFCFFVRYCLFCAVLPYIDNGATGTNFHRPGFQQMLSDIEAGHVNCVIVKDLSRLGRDTIDTGYYIEQYFRIRNIRFIAVNENFDTANSEDAHSGIPDTKRRILSSAMCVFARL